MGELVYRRAEPSDSEALCALMRETPMGQSIQVCQERGTDFFSGCYLQADEPDVWAAFEKDSGRAVGVFSAGRRPVFFKGDIREIRYLSDLRIRPEYRKGLLFSRGFKTLKKKVFEEGEWAQTLVLGDNAEARVLLTSGRAGLPVYHPCGSYRSWFLCGQQVRAVDTGIQVRKADADDTLKMQCLLEQEGPGADFTPWVEIAKMKGVDFRLAYCGTELVGMIGVWDTSSISQTQLAGYGAGMRIARPFYNTWAKIKGRPHLPEVGESIPAKALTVLICKDRDPVVFRALMASVLDAEGMFGIGLDVKDPLVKALHGLSATCVTASHFLVSFSGEVPRVEGPFYFDFARL